ncbi:hypothetical protein [Luteolibacter sp. Populi]|uniref:hypothetical protein n=1 Tax=Luteolibacter sp. Populi TaxID=3230487 RepID=UPI003467301C
MRSGNSPEVGVAPFDEDNGAFRYGKRLWTHTFEIEDSLNFAPVSGLSATLTWNYLAGDLDEWVEPVEDGTYIWEYDVSIFTEDYGTSDSWTYYSETETTPLLSTTTSWSGRNWAAWISAGAPGTPGDIQNRSGHELHTIVETDELSAPFTFPYLWNGFMASREWTELENPLVFSPATGAEATRAVYGDVKAKRMIRDQYVNNLNFGGGLISSASKSGSGGKQKRLKEIRWRWIKFDERDPFTTHPVAPPEEFTKKFHFALVKSDGLESAGSSPAQGVQTVSTVTLECEGGLEGWQTVDLSQYVEETPAYLDQFTFVRGGGTEVSLSLIDCKVYSADKFLAGSIFLNGPIMDASLEFVNTTTGESLGTYGPFFGSNPQHTYTAPRQILAPGDTYTLSSGNDDKVFFVRAPGNYLRVDFYTCFNGLGDIEVRLKKGGQTIGVIEHELKADPEFSEIIVGFDRWMKGIGFELGGGDIPPFGRGMSLLSSNDIDPLVSAALIPVFNVIGQVEGMTTVLKAFIDGARAGFNDDWMFLVDISTGLHLAGDWASTQVEAFLIEWRDNPELRKAELILAINRIADDWVVQPLSEVMDDFTTVEGIARRAWRAWEFQQRTEQRVRAFAGSAAKAVFEGMKEWVNDFCVRMMAGGENSRWITSSLEIRRLMPEGYADQLMGCYTFGYSLGYICEQVGTGVVTGGSMTLGKMFVKEGVAIGGLLAKRTLGTCTLRLVWLKRTLNEAGSVLLQKAIRDFYDDGLVYAATHGLDVTDVPTGSITDILENMMRIPGFQRSQYGMTDLAATIRELSNLRKLFSQGLPREVLKIRSGLPYKKAAALAFCMDGDITEDMFKNFMKILDRKLIEHGPGELFHEWADDFLRVARGSMSHFSATRSPLTRLSGEDAEWLKSLLGEPNPGYIWKFEEGAATGWKDPIRRGILVEVDLYHTVYRKQGWTHQPLTQGIDFTRGLSAVQVKSLGVVNEGTISRMKVALRDLVDVGEGNALQSLHLDMRTKPGLDTTTLRQQLDAEIVLLKQESPELDLTYSISNYQFVAP